MRAERGHSPTIRCAHAEKERSTSRGGRRGACGVRYYADADIAVKPDALRRYSVNLTAEVSSRAVQRQATAVEVVMTRGRSRDESGEWHGSDPSSAFGTFSPLRRGEGSRCLFFQGRVRRAGRAAPPLESLLPRARDRREVDRGREAGLRDGRVTASPDPDRAHGAAQDLAEHALRRLSTLTSNAPRRSG